MVLAGDSRLLGGQSASGAQEAQWTTTRTEEELMFERLLPTARAVLEHAHTEALRLSRSEVRAEHLLLALASTETGFASRVLASTEITPARIERAIEATVALELEDGPLTKSDAEALSTLGIELDQIRPSMEQSKILGSSPRRGRTNSRVRFSSEAKRALSTSVAYAQQQGQGYIGPEHLLLGVLSGKRTLAVELLDTLGIDVEALKLQVLGQVEGAA
jgi:ATP-dependent Clp protease ATP-binding subunit ClpA